MMRNFCMMAAKLFLHFFTAYVCKNLFSMELQQLILEAWNNRELLKEEKYVNAVKNVIEEVDKGRLRTASPTENGWIVNEWIKQAILLYFAAQPMETIEMPPF